MLEFEIKLLLFTVIKVHVDIQFTKPVPDEKYRNSKSYANKIISQNLLKDSKNLTEISLVGYKYTYIYLQFSCKLDGFAMLITFTYLEA